jgi:hypothetical protein
MLAFMLPECAKGLVRSALGFFQPRQTILILRVVFWSLAQLVAGDQFQAEEVGIFDAQAGALIAIDKTRRHFPAAAARSLVDSSRVYRHGDGNRASNSTER